MDTKIKDPPKSHKAIIMGMSTYIKYTIPHIARAYCKISRESVDQCDGPDLDVMPDHGDVTQRQN